MKFKIVDAVEHKFQARFIPWYLASGVKLSLYRLLVLNQNKGGLLMSEFIIVNIVEYRYRFAHSLGFKRYHMGLFAFTILYSEPERHFHCKDL